MVREEEPEVKFDPSQSERFDALKEGFYHEEHRDITDKFYDSPDFTLLRNNSYLRQRNGDFEVKVMNGTFHNQEIRGDDLITELNSRLGVSYRSVKELIGGHMRRYASLNTDRQVYRNEDVGILVLDEVTSNLDNYSQKMAEVELQHSGVDPNLLTCMVETFSLEVIDDSKIECYLAAQKPDVYESIKGSRS